MLRSVTYVLIVVILLNSGLGIAQNAGVFLTCYHFEINQTTYTKVKGKRYKLHSNLLFNTSWLKVTIGDSVYPIKKATVYGYRSEANKVYRFYKGYEYEIINMYNGSLLYSRTYFSGYKSNQVTKYFFSTSSGSEIYPLDNYVLMHLSNIDSVFRTKLCLCFICSKGEVAQSPY